MGVLGTKVKIIGWVAMSAVLAVMVSSCGYKLIDQRGIYGGDIKSVSLSVFKNTTYEPHVSLYVTNAFSRELVSIGLFDLNAPDADAHLEGVIKKILIVPSSLSGEGVVIEKTASLNVELSLYKKNGAFIKKWDFVDAEPYRVDDPQAEDYNKRVAFEVISGRIARKLTAVLLVDY